MRCKLSTGKPAVRCRACGFFFGRDSSHCTKSLHIDGPGNAPGAGNGSTQGQTYLPAQASGKLPPIHSESPDVFHSPRTWGGGGRFFLTNVILSVLSWRERGVFRSGSGLPRSLPPRHGVFSAFRTVPPPNSLASAFPATFRLVAAHRRPVRADMLCYRLGTRYTCAYQAHTRCLCTQ